MEQRVETSKRTAQQTTKDYGRNPYLFIVGCQRSGTTLLQRMVDAHPDVAIAYETNWVVHYFKKRVGLTSEGFVTPGLIPRLFEYRGLARLQMGKTELEKMIGGKEPVSYSQFISRVFDLYGKRRGKHLTGDKTPGYVRKLPTLHALWPEARFVHLIRDGRDVCLSILNWKMADRIVGRFATWSEDRVSTTALWWKRSVGLGREAGNSLGSDLYYEMRYEPLIEFPKEECIALCAFLGLPYDDAMTRSHENRQAKDSRLHGKQEWFPITPGLRDWRSQMPDEDVERFEAAAGDLLEELGYPRAFPNPRPEALDHASRIRELFTQDVRSRGSRLPGNW